LFITNRNGTYLNMALAPYISHLTELPFVRAVRVQLPAADAQEVGGDGVLEVSTPNGRHVLHVEEKRTHVTRDMVEHLIAVSRRRNDLILFLPHVGRELGATLADAKVKFMDLAGNCFVQFGDEYIARVQGNPPAEASVRDRALRAPSYRVLFALLAKPDLLNAPARELAAASGGVSPQTVLDVRERFVATRAFLRVGSRQLQWAPQGRRQLLDLWGAGARATLYPHLLLGRYRARERDLARFETLVVERLQGTRWAWGGAAAAHKLTGFYRGIETVLYVDDEDAPSRYPRRLELVPDAEGAVRLMRSPAPLALEGPDRTAHPLLVYTDLLHESESRAHEAATVFAEKYLKEDFLR
jgi:hypothetical protein